ncbi:unnamed protein product [Hermetia illucens]|uniref:RRP12-like protein n=1 Tax=Hermetia illucens TaxID=343691 RepID=A0A7R8YWN0_HERIL|nr:unnamed protein product [Hermetia illucens]
MAKFRSKLKRHTKGKTWAKGHSSTSNPENMKHRMNAKSRFFQANWKSAPPTSSSAKPSLTLEALMKHDARQMYATGKDEPTVNDIAGSLKSFSLDDEMMSDSQTGTFKTFKTFASNYSQCSNMSFKKLLNGFRTSSNLHKEMLAILTALTEVIKERKGTESSTEYFLLLMETIDASQEETEIFACISLLSMGIKTVPVPVLRKKFSETAGSLMQLMTRYIESENMTVIRHLIGCMSVLLRAQEHVSWSYSSTMRYLDAILSFTIHSKPKVRKAAQHAVVSIIQGSCFMLPRKPENTADNPDEPEEPLPPAVTYHPASGRVAKFCLSQFKPENLSKSQKLVLHTIALLRDTMSGMKTDDVRQSCESLLSIMTAANVLLRTTCFQTFHAFFLSRTTNIDSELLGKLISAIYEYRPDRMDIRQTLAWLAVLKEGHIHLAKLDLNLCANFLPKFVDVCASDLWMSDKTEIVTGASNTLKEILYECVRPACATDELRAQNREPITKVINIISKALAAPFGDVAKYVILTFAIVFEVTGPDFSKALHAPIATLGNRYDTNSTLRLAIEHAIITAIQFVGVENVLKAIPLADAKGEVLIDRSWLLPLLRVGIVGASFEFFSNYILELAYYCNTKWDEYKKEGNDSKRCTYELLCCQLWGLFPGFCRNPKDYSSFKLVAKKLGTALENNPEFRAPILDGLNELITYASEQNVGEIAKYSKNFVPCLLNIYIQKPNDTYETEMRGKILETIKVFLTITSEQTLVDLFENAVKELKDLPPGNFTSDACMDAANLLVVYQNAQNIKNYYEKFIAPVLKKDNKTKVAATDDQKLKKRKRKSYELLNELIASDREECKKFMKKNATAIEELLLKVFPTCPISQASRLSCLKLLIEKKYVSIKDKYILEAVLTFKEFSTKKQDIADQLLKLIGEIYEKKDKLDEFINIIMAGFGESELSVNTIFALRSVVQHLTGSLTVKTLEVILQEVLVFLTQKIRPEAEAAVVFLITFVKVLPSPLVANHLEPIMKSLSSMCPDTKRYCRLQIGYLLKKMCKRFTADELIKLVPGNDELTHRRLKKIRKQLRREERQKAAEKDSDEDESENEFVSGGLEKKSLTIEDILADSDSDLPDDDMDEAPEANHGNKKKFKVERNIHPRRRRRDCGFS